MILAQDRCYLVAEIGINGNGSVDLAKDLIYQAYEAGFDCVKFQKRTVDEVYTKEELDAPRESPFGTTNREQKYGIEYTVDQYNEISNYCTAYNIPWTASPWDIKSIEFLVSYDPPYIKIPSALATHKKYLEACAATKLPLFMSRGGMSLGMIHKALDVVEKAGSKIDCIYHTCSAYPSAIEDLNLLAINTLQKEFPDIPIGYSGHETGVTPSIMAAVLGAVSIERHITINRAMYGSDQAASLEPDGMRRLVRGVRAWEKARGHGKVMINKKEEQVMKKLRKVNDL